MSRPIPFSRPHIVGTELGAIGSAITRQGLSGDGYFTKRCHAKIEASLGVVKALLTTSCTHALELSALLLNIRPGDEVIVPAYTFVSTANAFVLHGAKPIFADIRPDTINIDERTLETLITPRTRAIVVVHYAGVGCEMDEISKLADRHGITVVEDNAHGLFGTYRGRYLGTIGAIGALSFHETKNFTCGEGGALLLNDERLIGRAEILREKGTDRSRFLRGQVDKYSWRDVGSSYLPADVLAAFLDSQLEARDRIQDRRQQIFERYENGLRDWARTNCVNLPTVPAHCGQAFHMFYMLLPSGHDRDALLAHLKDHGIQATFHYVPLHDSPMGQSFGYRSGQLPVAERVARSLIRLPFFFDMSDEDVDRVIATVRAFSTTVETSD
jgi:dTDP-4-amino-4,6-dideoxygalactose transaminase